MALVFADKSLQTGPTLFTPLLKWVNFKVTNAKILYQPGVFGGDGTEMRVNICIQSEEGEEEIRLYERSLTGNVCSCIKEGHIKAKMSWDKVRFFDIAGKAVDKPNRLAGYKVNLVFLIKGKWAAMGKTGLCLEVSDIQLVEEQEPQEFSPFEDLTV